MEQHEKDEWAAALRDPKRYVQLMGSLVRRGCKSGEPLMACCIGVKADLQTHGRLRQWVLAEAPMESYEPFYDLSGIPEGNRQFFIELNDKYDLNFNEIALVIENVPEAQWL